MNVIRLRESIVFTKLIKEVPCLWAFQGSPIEIGSLGDDAEATSWRHPSPADSSKFLGNVT